MPLRPAQRRTVGTAITVTLNIPIALASTSGSAPTIGGTSSDAGGANSAWDAISPGTSELGEASIGDKMDARPGV
jgi:hypothetical protein